jgi:hypothetical protein
MLSISEHVQSTPTLHPNRRSARTWRVSRLLLLFTFRVQKPRFELGSFARLQPSCPCQKQPWTNSIAFTSGITTSGVPGRPFTNRRCRTPNALRTVQSALSGPVFRPRIRDMICERLAFENTSGTLLLRPVQWPAPEPNSSPHDLTWPRPLRRSSVPAGREQHCLFALRPRSSCP